MDILVKAQKDTIFKYEVFTSSKNENYAPQVKLAEYSFELTASDEFKWVTLPINCTTNTGKIFIEFKTNENIILGMTADIINGIMCLSYDNLPEGSTYVDIETHVVKTQHWTPLNFLPCFKCNDGDDIRITSYNVCYTKLLRASTLQKNCRAAASPARRR